MSELLERRTEEILKLLADPTRQRILRIISEKPMNPQTLAEKLNISRPAVEKHLKLLQSSYICERTVEPFTRKWLYFVSNPGLEVINDIKKAVIIYYQTMNGIISAELEKLDRDFVLGRISRSEYNTRKPYLSKKQTELEELQLTKIWVEEAKRVISEYMNEKSEE